MGLWDKVKKDVSNTWKKSDVGRAVSGSTDGFNRSLHINRKGFNKDWVPGLRVAGATGLGFAVGGPIGAGIAGGLTAAGQYGGGGASSGEAPKPKEEWWKEGRPDTRREITNADGDLKNAYKLQQERISAPQSRLGEIDTRLKNIQGVQYGASVGGIGAAAGLAGLSARALSNDLSGQAQARMGLIDQQMRGSMDALNQNAAGGLAGGMSNLAASGGMDSGARARMASDAMKARMSGASSIFNNAGQNKSQVGIQDMNNQYDLQTRMPGMFMDFGRNEIDAQKFNAGLGMDKFNAYQNQGRLEDDRRFIASRDNADNAMRTGQFNIQNAIGDKAASDAFDMDKWKTQNAAKAGEMTANAQNYYADKQSKRGLLGNRGGILGTGIGE
jgi:hypothetical protein